MPKFQARRPAKGRRPERERQVASIGVMEQTLDEMYAALSNQVREYVYIVHMENVEPRLRRLEMPWYRRLWADFEPLRLWVKSKFQKKIEEVASTAPICSCGVEPEHTMGGAPDCKFIMGASDASKT